jgi:type II secretory pathway pseudopilin PulG
MDRPTTPGDRLGRPGYALIVLMMAVFVLSLGALIAVPVWQTELQREKEEELIFRGKQYAEAVRIFVQKNPGRFPASLKDLLDKKCIRRLYKDPFGPDGQWNVILASTGASTGASMSGASGGTSAAAGGLGQAAQEVLVAPERVLPAIKDPRILGVVSSSTSKSIKIYNDQESHDKWLFFFGQDPKKPPRIVYYGEKH